MYQEEKFTSQNYVALSGHSAFACALPVPGSPVRSQSSGKSSLMSVTQSGVPVSAVIAPCPFAFVEFNIHIQLSRYVWVTLAYQALAQQILKK